jgi:hypothetical protein
MTYSRSQAVKDLIASAALAISLTSQDVCSEIQGLHRNVPCLDEESAMGCFGTS